MSMNHLAICNLLTLSAFGKIGPRGYAKLSTIPQFLNTPLSKRSISQIKAVGVPEQIALELIEFIKQFDPEHTLKELSNHSISLVTQEEDDYPLLLSEISDPPYLLYVMGSLKSLTNPSLAVVGSRKSSHYGHSVVEMLVPQLTQHTVTIISGLALGIDALAHKTTLEAGGATVAIIGSGLDRIYPSVHQKLAQNIVDAGGAVVSEYFLGTPPLKQHFPARNRLISGVSRGVLVVECDIESGAMITARCALDQNREVFAIPGSIVSPFSRGPNALIRLGAHPVTEAKDIIEELDLAWLPGEVQTIPAVALSDHEQKIFEVLSHEPIHIDVLVEQIGLDTADINASLLFLEMKGMVKNVGAAHYIRR